jgi:hypothetical protein
MFVRSGLFPSQLFQNKAFKGDQIYISAKLNAHCVNWW